MKTIRIDKDACQLAKCVAPEDLNCGEFVAALNVIREYPSFMWCCDGSDVQPHEPVRIQYQESGSGTPLKVKAICLPFVFVKFPNGKSQTIDVRLTQFVRLNADYASVVWDEMKR